MAGNYKLNFKDLKQRVGIDDVAYSLGYRLDKKAGVGKYIELVLGDSKAVTDRIIISNPSNKGAQGYFRRNGSSGDVITFIKENLNSFVVSGKSEWQKIGNIMAKFANMPEVSYADKIYTEKAKNAPTVFDATRFEIQSIPLNTVPYLLNKRGLTAETINAFGDSVVLIRDKMNERFDGFNIGFPYHSSLDKPAEGFEVRGHNGYKGKAAGSNSTSAAWMADLSGKREAVDHVFFFESALDAMAFYQVNRPKLANQHIALISLGGTFSDAQVNNVLKQFPNAKLHDAFDNDIAGNIYSVRLAAIAENKSLKISKKDDIYEFVVNERSFSLKSEDVSLKSFYANVSSRRPVKSDKAPPGYKDWNDYVLGKSNSVNLTPSKYERDINLAEKRNSSLKM